MHGYLARYVKLRVAHAPGLPGSFSPPSRVTHPDMQHGTCMTHVPWCILGSLTSGFLRNRWWGKRSQHFWRMHSPQYYVSGNRPMGAHSSCQTIETCKRIQIQVQSNQHHTVFIDILRTYQPLPEPMLINHQRCLVTFASVQFHKICLIRYISLIQV